MSRNGMRPVHPGEILRDELEALDMSAKAFAAALDVPGNRITAILNGSVALALIRRCAYRAIWAQRRNFG